MYKYLVGIFLVCILAICIAGATIPPVIPNSFVQDHANVLSIEDRAKLEAQLREFQQNWNIEFAVATVTTTDGVDKFDYSLQMAREYGIGSKDGEKRGLLLFLAVQDRNYFIQISRHMESYLTDGESGSIMRASLVPNLKIASKTNQSSDWLKALSTTVTAINTSIKNKIEPEHKDPPPPTDFTILWWILGIFGSIVGIVGGGLVLHTRNERIKEEERQENARKERERYLELERKREREHQAWLKTPAGQKHLKEKREREQREAEKRRKEHEAWLRSPAGIAETKRQEEEERKRRKKREEEDRKGRDEESSYSSSSSYSSNSSSSSYSSGSSSGFGGGGDFGGGGSGGSW